MLHKEREHIASRPATEAIIHLLFGADTERRRLFLMERTSPQKALPALLELDIGGNHVDNVGRASNFVNFFVWYAHDPVGETMVTTKVR